VTQLSNAASTSPLRLGIVGFGAAAQAFLPAIQSRPDWRLCAIAEAAPAVRQNDTAAGLMGYGLAGIFESLDEMLNGCELDVIYIATPTPLHCQQVLSALAAGKHVIVEKPMAINLTEALRMADAADAANRVLLVGHSHSFDQPIARMRQIIESGRLGRVQMVNTWCYTDWMQRPRRAEELDSTLGGGVTFRQGAHQFDILRLLCGGAVHSVRAKTFDWMQARRGTGAHTVLLDFENGAAGTAVYNGYGGFASMDIGFDISEWGLHQPREHRNQRAAGHTSKDLQADPAAELLAKQVRAKTAIADFAPHPPFFGLTVVSCEGGDIRQSPKGLYIETREGREEIVLAADPSPRQAVLDEMLQAIRGHKAPLHNARWGAATLAVCEAAMASSAQRREIILSTYSKHERNTTHEYTI
jgi:phthalate 4,5-cis-dihydrodiol dehydrogenase